MTHQVDERTRAHGLTLQPLMNTHQMNQSRPIQILIVDDEPGTLQLLRMVLQAEGHEIVQAHDGAEAIAAFNQARPDLVVLDILLPKVDGLDVLKTIRAQDMVAGVIMISALSSEQLAVRAMLAGADDYLGKPLSLKTLRLHIRQVMERVQLRRQNLQLQQQLVAANEKLRRYMAAPFLQTLLATPPPPRLGGERPLVTVLFLDFCDFTATTLHDPPDEIVRMLNEYFALLTGAVLDNGGYLDKIMGDGFMALFNVPIQQAGHANAAVRTALEMRSRVQQWNRQSGARRRRMNVRGGINTGEAVVGNIGTSHLMNFTAIGREVTLAKRLEEEARPGQILIGADTYTLLDLEELGLSTQQVASGGLRRLRGFDQPCEVFEVIGEAGASAAVAVEVVRRIS